MLKLPLIRLGKLLLASLQHQATDGAREIGPIRWAQGRALAALGRGAEGWAALTAAGAMGAADASVWWWLGALASGQGQRTLAREMRQISADLTPGGSPLGSREDR